MCVNGGRRGDAACHCGVVRRRDPVEDRQQPDEHAAAAPRHAPADPPRPRPASTGPAARADLAAARAQQLEQHEHQQHVRRDQLDRGADPDQRPRRPAAVPAGTATARPASSPRAPGRRASPIRPWTSIRLSAAISVAAPSASQSPPPAARTSANMPRIASDPSSRLRAATRTGRLRTARSSRRSSASPAADARRSGRRRAARRRTSDRPAERSRDHPRGVDVVGLVEHQQVVVGGRGTGRGTARRAARPARRATAARRARAARAERERAAGAGPSRRDGT